MSIFPFIDPEALVASQDNALPMFREYAYDYENNRLLLRDGQTYLVEGNEALRIWIFKALDTERFRYTAYDSDYGSEIDTLIGAINSSVILPELKRFIIEAVLDGLAANGCCGKPSWSGSPPMKWGVISRCLAGPDGCCSPRRKNPVSWKFIMTSTGIW